MRRFANLFLMIFSLLITLVMVEVGLRLLKYPSVFKRGQAFPVEVDRAWHITCDELLGCVFDADYAHSLGGRFAQINPQGFYDADAFTADALPSDDTFKILLLGDSFTFGAAAEMGQSFAERLEADLAQRTPLTVWNTGIPGTGTNNALIQAQRFLPIMQPNVVILGIYSNDYADNLLPVEAYYADWLGKYSVSPDLEIIELTPEAAFYRNYGVFPPANRAQFMMGRTRVGSLVMRTVDGFQEGGLSQIAMIDAWQFPEDWWQNTYFEAGIQQTKKYVEQIHALTRAQGIPLVILAIPYVDDVKEAYDPRHPYAQAYHATVAIAQEVGDTLADPRPILIESDYAPLPNGHWNNEGHAKVAELLEACLRPMLDGESLPSVCPIQ